jgi:acetyl/propionyl-CoA carboxylase alpha subunit
MIDRDHLEVHVAGTAAEPGAGWELEWVDRASGIVRARKGGRAVMLLVEGVGSHWAVTIRGRRIPVEVRGWRERVLARAETAARDDAGPLTVSATLPGLIVTVAVRPGDEVQEGDPLLTIEAMKMQNEVRAPRGGRIIEVSIAPGQAVATGVALLRLE